MAREKKPPKLDSAGDPILWENIDPATLTGKPAAAYKALRESWSLTADASAAMREALTATLPPVPKGLERRISFQYGAIGIAVCAPDGPRAATGRMSLVEYNKLHAA
jgi:hypothetical protein